MMATDRNKRMVASAAEDCDALLQQTARGIIDHCLLLVVTTKRFGCPILAFRSWP